MKQINYLLLKYFKTFEKTNKKNYNKDNDIISEGDKISMDLVVAKFATTTI